MYCKYLCSWGIAKVVAEKMSIWFMIAVWPKLLFYVQLPSKWCYWNSRWNWFIDWKIHGWNKWDYVICHSYSSKVKSFMLIWLLSLTIFLYSVIQYFLRLHIHIWREDPILVSHQNNVRTFSKSSYSQLELYNISPFNLCNWVSVPHESFVDWGPEALKLPLLL